MASLKISYFIYQINLSDIFFLFYVFKQKEKQKKMIEQQKHAHSSSHNTTTNHSTAPRYASSDMISSIHSAPLTGRKSQSQALIGPASSPGTVYKNVDAIATDSIQSYIDDESQQQPQQENLTNDRTTEIQAFTQC